MALSFDQLESVATNSLGDDLSEQVLNTNALTAYLSQPGRMLIRDGGIKLQFAVTTGDETDATGGWYSNSENLDSTEYEPISAATYDWCNVHETLKIGKPELLKASGDNAKLSLLAERIKLCKEYMSRRLGTAIHTGAGTTDFVGLSTAISTSATYGGIAVADLPEWIAVVLGNSSVDRALTLGLLNSLFAQTKYDKEEIDIMVGRSNVYEKMWQLYQPYQRLEAYSDEMAKLGFKKIPVINGVPFIIDSQTQAKSIRGINSNFLKLVAHRDENMRVVSHEKLEGSNAIQRRIFFMGSLVCKGRRYQGSIDDIDVA